MFAYIQGKLVRKEPTYVVIDVGGVGYEIRISLNTFSALQLNDSCKLHTYLHVREDAQLLYGFIQESEKSLFLHLISVSGIGTNTAIVLLSSLSAQEIRQAIVEENHKLIQTAKGIGTKTAQRVVLELKDKIQKEGFVDEIVPAGAISHQVKEEALLALTTLGIAKNAAEKSIARILKKYGNDISLEQIIKYALRN